MRAFYCDPCVLRALALTLLGTAAPAPPPPPPPTPPIPLTRLVCLVEQARRLPLADLGVPAGSRPLDLALGKGTVWVLFAPSLLVGVPRAAPAGEPAAHAEYGAIEEVDMIPGPRPDAWQSLAADPWDGTLWLASPAGLWRRRPGRRPEPVRVGKPAAGGFRQAVPARGAVWAAPACDADAVWRLDNQGKVLGTGLPDAAAPGGCAAAELARDWSGDLLALRPATGEVLRLAFDGTWQPHPGIAAPAPPPAGRPPIRRWFFWGTEPVALADTPEGEGSVIYRRDAGAAGAVAAFREDCGPGDALVAVAGDSRGWAALTRRFLLVGEHRRDGVSH